MKSFFEKHPGQILPIQKIEKTTPDPVCENNFDEPKPGPGAIALAITNSGEIEHIVKKRDF